MRLMEKLLKYSWHERVHFRIRKRMKFLSRYTSPRVLSEGAK